VPYDAHAKTPGHGERRQGYSAMSGLTVMFLMLQATCHRRLDGMPMTRLAVARLAKG
jgi:hypothetical protein